MSEVLMRIGEIAAFFGVSAKAMRIYEKKGLLRPANVDKHTGYRYYAADQVRQLDALLELKRLGFALAEIKNILAGGIDKNKYMEALVHKKTAWRNRISDAEHRIDRIDEIIQKLETGIPATKLHELTEDERAALIAKMVCLEDMPAASELSDAIWL